MDEQNPKQSGLNIEVPETDLQLSSGSITSDVKLNSGTDNNVDVEQEAFDMDKLSVSNPVKYLVTYNSPREWILDQREAEVAQMIRDTAMPEQASKVGSIAYAAGELKRKTGNMARDFSEYAAGVNAYLFPNSNKEVAQRVYKNMKKLSVQTENNRADYISEHGVDPDIYGPATNIMEVARDMVLTAGVAGAARRSATKAAFGYASSRLAPSAVGVAERFAVQQGKKVASGVAKTAIAGETFMREAGDRATQQAAQYMEATGDYDLKYYDPTVDLALNTGVSAINSAVEMSLGVERVVPDMIFGTRSVGRFAEEFIKGYISERSEEFLQNFFDQGGDLLSGYRDNISLAQAWSDSSSAGWIGGIFRSGAATGMYYLNRRRMIRQLQENGIEKDIAAKFVDKVLRDGIDKTLSNMSSTVELRTKDGPAYEKMKAGIKNALLMQGWNEKMVDPQTGEVRNIDSYVETFINNDAINKAISEALSSGLSIDDWLDIAQFAAIDNVLYVRPMGSVEDIQKRIDEQDAIIKRQTELKKTGAEKPGVLQEARTAKAILQKLKANKLLDGEIERVSIEEAKTPEIQKEIDTATSDAGTLGKANSAADFVGGLENMTDEEKTRRLGNAVMKRIFKDDKRGFDAVMTKPEYANVRAAINSSAAKIFDYIKAHRAYGVAKDLYDALKLLPTVKSGNFISTVNTPDLTGQDPVARNAFLYNFVFNDAHATSAFIDAYLIRAEESITNQTKVRLGKKDLVGQAFKAMDALMQTQADVAGLQYTSTYNEDGSVADPNVAAVMASWQNLFVEVPEQRRLPQRLLEQFDLADENARLDDIYPEYTGDTIEVDGKVRTVYNSEGKRINKSAEALRNFWRWFGDSKAVDKKGRPLVVYHGARGNGNITIFDPQKGQNVEAVYFSKDINVAGHWSVKHAPKTFESAEKIKERISKITDVDELLTIHNRYDYDTLKVVEDKRNKGTFWLEGIYSIELLGEKAGDNIYVNKFGQKTDLAELLRKKIEQAIPDAIESDLYSVYMKLENPLIIDAGGKPYWQIDFRGEKVNTESIARFAKENGFDGLIVNNVLETDYENKLTDDYIAFEPTQIKSVENLGYYNAQDPRMLYQTNVYDGLTTTNSVMSVTNILQQLKDGSHERLLFDTRNGNWYLANADEMVHADMFVRAFRQGNYPEFNNEREAEQYFQENYLSDDPTLFQFMATKYDNPADTREAMEHTIGTDEYTNAYLRDDLVVFARSETELAESGFPVEGFDHYKVEYDENGNRKVVLVDKATEDINEVLYQIAYAGAPVDYNKPSLKFIGSGEGAASHGWGLYYALDPMIAEMYRQKFVFDYRHVTLYKGEEVDVLKEDTPHDQALSDLVRDYSSIKDTDMSVRKQKFIKKYEDEIASTKQYVKENEDRLKQETIRDSSRTMFDFYQEKIKHDEAMLDAFKNIDATQIKEKQWGQVHEVDIPEMDVLLDEQKMLIDQPKYVEDIIWKINKDLDLGIVDSGITGDRIYQKISDKLGSDKAASQYLDKEGIKGITYYGREDGRCFVIFNDKSVKVLRKKFDELGNQLFSLDFFRPKLVVTHGISSYNLDKALELGGLPAPSLAIVKASDPRTEFGDIKLVGTADMIDPANPQNKVYDRDIWSQRVPQPEYKKVPSAKIRPLREKFDAVFARVGETQKLNEVIHTLTNTARPEDAIGYFQNSDAAQVYYVENVLGKKIDIPTYDVAEKIRPNLTLFATPDDQFIEEISKIDLNIDNSLVLKAKIMPVVMGLIERNDFEKKYGQHAEKFKQKAIEYYNSDNFNTSKMFELVEETKRYLREKGKREIDKLALFDKLKEYRLWDDPRYMMWARDQFNGILGEPRVRVGGKLVEWNAENLVKAMTRGPTVGSEKAFPGVGQAIAAGATRFSNLEEIREAGRRLKTIDEANSVTDKAGNAVTAFAEGLIDKFGEDYREDIYKATAKIAGLGTPTASNIENIISRAVGKSANLTNEEIASAKKMAQLIKDVTRSYFEAKPQRVVSFDEFVGAIVPTNPAYDESAQKLADRGLTVVRSDDVAEGMEELSSLREEVLFQGRRAKINGVYDPELGTILIGKNFNGTTLPHEMAHYWLDTIFKVFKQAQAGKLNVRPEWMAQKREMFAMLGINENQTSLTRGQQEKFATMLEAYISGVGVTNEITRTFTDYLKWVPEKYRNLQQLSYVDENGKIQNVFLDAKAVEFFNKWYENPTLPSLSTSPERQRFMNVTSDDGNVIRVSIKEINDREKEFAQDAEEQLHTDQRLYNTLDENMPAEIKVVSDAQKVVISERGNFLKATEEEQKKIITPDDDRKRRWFERKSRQTEAQLAQEYIEKNPEHAHEVIFGDPELIPNDTGIDRATLINTYMATNGITEDKPEWAQLHTNIAINQSLAGTQLALSNDKSYRTYLDALREIEEALELKAATNYAGASVGARERFNSDIQQFLSKELPAVFATEAGSKEREIALKQMFEKARTTFSGNTTGRFLTQMDMEYAKAQKRNTDAFVKWAEKVIKTEAGAKLNAEQQAHLLKISAKAQQALTDIDSKDAGVAVAGALELRKWQLEKQKLMGVAPKKFSLFGDYAPRAMLASPNTLLFANIPSTAINTLVTNLAKRGDLFGENNVSEKLIKNEIKRIKAIYGSTAMNLAQMEKPTSPTLLHGEKYSASGQKWYDPYTILGREDNLFRVPTFVNTLARIASKDAKATGRNADEVFLEYIKLNDQSDSAKLARKQALAVANMAVFTQNGALARCLNHIRSELNYLSRAPLGLDPHGFGLGSLIAPFLSTGANIAEMGIRGTIAPIVTLTTYAQALRTGKAIDPLKKLALRMDWTYFVFSAVSMALLAALTSDDDEFYIDPYKAGMGYDPDRPYDSINIGGVWVDLDFFGPFAIPMRTAAKVIQAWKKDNGVGTSLGMGYAESAESVLGDIPLAESIINNQFEWAMKKPGAFAGSYVYNQGNKLVPAGIKPISRALSRGQGWMLRPFEGTTVGRKFNRNYGFDGQELTSQDLLEMFTIKFQLGPDAQQYLNNILGLQ